MKQIDVSPTADVIIEMSKRASDLSNELQRIAGTMLAKDNIEYASDAHAAIFTFLINARLDLLITRPLREFMKEE